MSDDVLRDIGCAYLADSPAPWWLDGSRNQLSDLLTHPSRAVAVFDPNTAPKGTLAQAAFTQLRFPYDNGTVLFGPRFAVSYAMRCNGGRPLARAYYNWVEESDTDATVELALGLWNRSAGAGTPFFLLDHAFDTARCLLDAH